MTTLCASLVIYGLFAAADYVTKRRQGYSQDWPVGPIGFGLWAAYLLVA